MSEIPHRDPLAGAVTLAVRASIVLKVLIWHDVLVHPALEPAEVEEQGL